MDNKFEKVSEIALKHFGEELKVCQQSKTYHAEGSVYNHTVMVLDELRKLKEYKQYDSFGQCILETAAVLHDVGKIKATVFTDGDWHSPKHSSIGCNASRRYLWSIGFCGGEVETMFREAVCMLVKHHSVPPAVERMEDPVLQLIRIASNGIQVPVFNVKMLCVLAKADVLGRHCKKSDKDYMLENIEFCQMLAENEGCYTTPYQFKSSNVRRKYLNGNCIWAGQELYDESWGEVVLMSGLPGTGKDTWISKHLNNIPMIRLDVIRSEKKISPRANQGEVVSAAKELAKEYMRKKTPFVWNATNITQHLRKELVEFFESYKARVRIVYLESTWGEILRKNISRGDAVPVAAIEGMLKKTVPPYAYEADNVEWHIM